MKKRLVAVILCLFVLASSFTAAAYAPSDFAVEAEGAMLVNLDTGYVIYEKNADKKLYPASLTKLMTALLLYENTKDLDAETVTVSKHALDLLIGTGSSLGGLKAGETLTVRQMLYVLLLSSANDGANAIAEHVAGDISSFVKLMNDRAKELGMTNTSYANAHGLHNENHYTTVRDMYILTQKFLSIPLLKEISYTCEYTLPATNKSGERSYHTTNLLMLENGGLCTAEKYKGQPYYYEYAHGVKTGYTDPAGRCLISTATKNGITYLCILMKSTVYGTHGKVRLEFGDSKALYEWAFNGFSGKAVATPDNAVESLPVKYGKGADTVPACPKDTLEAVLPNDADPKLLKYDICWISGVSDGLTAPIKRGTALGTCDISYDGELLGTVELVAGTDISRNELEYIVNSAAFRITVTVILVIVGLFFVWCLIAGAIRRNKRKKRASKINKG